MSRPVKCKHPHAVCGDCTHHVCECACMTSPGHCGGYCDINHHRRVCDARVNNCEDYEKIDWQPLWDGDDDQ